MNSLRLAAPLGLLAACGPIAFKATLTPSTFTVGLLDGGSALLSGTFQVEECLLESSC